MSKYTFSTQSGKAYYFNSIPKFIADKSTNIVGCLMKHAFDINKAQANAWENQVEELQRRLEECGMEGDIIFEYDIVRRGKRIDVILLIRHMVFSLEFKNGKDVFTAQDAQQAEDYAIDIKNFHKESENLYVCPILIATDAEKYPKTQSTDCYPDKQVHLQRENIETLIPKISEISSLYGEDGEIDFEKWFNSPYYPTPTIIAAAVEAYSSHDLSQIAQSEAGQEDIDLCESEIYKIIDYARTEKKKCICFVTGVPGAGKTLVGLDVVAKSLDDKADSLSVYLSGNGPLVEVLRAALKKSVDDRDKERSELWRRAKDAADKSVGKSVEVSKPEKLSNKHTQAAINTLIQSSYAFKKDNALHSKPTPENILIFDEAQRVWNQEKMARKHDDPLMAVSEPKLLFSIMDRHEDWAVMICLVGLGQDIYDGEVGINEWFRCGIEEFKDWELYYSPLIFNQAEDKNIDRDIILACQRCHQVPEMHLKTSIRSFRAGKQCQFVDSLLDNDQKKSSEIYKEISDKYPIYITRDYERAKRWVREQVRGS